MKTKFQTEGMMLCRKFSAFEATIEQVKTPSGKEL